MSPSLASVAGPNPGIIQSDIVKFIHCRNSLSECLSDISIRAEDVLLVATSSEIASLDPNEQESFSKCRFSLLLEEAIDGNVPQGVIAQSLASFRHNHLFNGYANRIAGERIYVTICGALPLLKEPPSNFRVVAIVAVFNEHDIISHLVEHLVQQGVEIYVMDNWSTDGTFEILSTSLHGLLLGLERYPADKPSTTFDLYEQLIRKEELARDIEASWFIHCDADEFRHSPFMGTTVREGLYNVDQQGFNAVNHTTLEFPPNDIVTEAIENPEIAFLYFRFAQHRGDLLRVNCWKKTDQEVRLAKSAGHRVMFKNIKIYPFQFLAKHYPFRSQKQGQRKLFYERLPRYPAAERQNGWHTHYDHISRDYSFIMETSDLTFFDNQKFPEEFLIQRLTGYGVHKWKPR
jgi:hypothetical protein